MALVGQEPVLFDISIYENIAWGSESTDVTMEKVLVFLPLFQELC